MSRAIKIILRTILGAVCAAISGAALLGIPTYLSTESSFLGPESNWALVGAIAGGVLGIVPGALIGFLVAKYQLNKLISLIAGAAVGIIILVWLFINGLDPFIDDELFYTGLAAIPICALIGLIIEITNPRQPQN